LRFVELVEGVKAVGDLPAVLIEGFDAVVIADLHLGFEEEMATKGVYLPRMQLKRALQVVEKLKNATGASTLVVAGDLKHKFEELGRREAKDLREFVSQVSKLFRRVIVVRGNHDTFIRGVASRYGFEVYDKLILGDALIIHGHEPLDPWDRERVVVMGHEHPSIGLRDQIGSVGKVPVFLVTPLKRGSTAVVLPAVGAYQTGTTITLARDLYLSPVIRAEGLLEESKPYALVEGEGVFELPKLADIEEALRSIEAYIPPEDVEEQSSDEYEEIIEE